MNQNIAYLPKQVVEKNEPIINTAKIWYHPQNTPRVNTAQRKFGQL